MARREGWRRLGHKRFRYVDARSRACFARSRDLVNDCLLAVDLFSEFDHADGERLLRSLRDRRTGFEEAFADVRACAIPAVYANDSFGVWDGDVAALVRRALDGPGGDVLPRAQTSGG